MNTVEELTKWIDLEELNRLMNSFCDMSGMSAIAIDTQGKILSSADSFPRLCTLAHDSSAKVFSLCRSCIHYGALECSKSKCGAFCYCHMGLVDFSAPIIVEGQIIGYIAGGMVFEREPERHTFDKIALRYGIDSDELWKAALEIPVCSIDNIVKASNFLYNMSIITINTINSRIQSYRASSELRIASQLKDDFLANMSHEIRTPMNAVIGMADIALQEDLTPVAADYIRQIQTSGKALLHIINDILDYSKISSGKLDIFEEEYNLSSMIKDVSSIISNRIKDKSDRVSLFFDINPNIPSKLIGDSSRIKQILINIANNAVKFTNDGLVTISINHKFKSASEIILDIRIKDTGIGIKNEDIPKLFKSFSQVDSKRNRNVEGTGLGLAIVKQLIELMNGQINVDSKYGIGSTFSVEIPQKISVNKPLVSSDNASDYAVIGLFENTDEARHFQNSLDTLKIQSHVLLTSDSILSGFESWYKAYSSHKLYIVVEQKYAESQYFEKINLLSPKYKDIHKVLLLNSYDSDKNWAGYGFDKIIRKPFSILSIESFISDFVIHEDNEDLSMDDDYDFIAPTARVLVVDDTPINLRVAEKLFGAYEIKTDKAISGKQAIEKVIKVPYDIIFMDHMMPELDGIDTTRIIRRFHPKLNSIPIIALTANVTADARKLFIDEGMVDFIAKPIEIKILREKLLKWLPSSKVIKKAKN